MKDTKKLKIINLIRIYHFILSYILLIVNILHLNKFKKMLERNFLLLFNLFHLNELKKQYKRKFYKNSEKQDRILSYKYKKSNNHNNLRREWKKQRHLNKAKSYLKNEKVQNINFINTPKHFKVVNCPKFKIFRNMRYSDRNYNKKGLKTKEINKLKGEKEIQNNPIDIKTKVNKYYDLVLNNQLITKYKESFINIKIIPMVQILIFNIKVTATNSY